VTTAILGGVFDPPHLGHVALAEGARDQLGADRLLVLVAERPGHKGVVADAETRRHLAELALGRFGEVRLDDHPYTVDFLRDAGLDHPYFVLGGDEWESFATWREPDEVRRLARIAVGSRPGFEPPEGDVDLLRIEQRPVSSSEVRARVAAGEPINGLVPAEVAREIERLGLYRDPLPSSGRG
jgi:nicotinate-nucleotide adenylyltransferase